MGNVPFAFSVHHFVSTVGADVGFASIIGLAILALLYFAQARETASLREQAEDSAEHLRELELRLTQLSQGSAGAAPRSGAGTGTITPLPASPPAGFARAAGPTTSAPAGSAAAVAAARTGSAAPVSARAASPVANLEGIPAAPAGVGAPALSAATRLIPSRDPESISIRANGASDPAGSTSVLSPAGPSPATAAGVANGSGSSPGQTTVAPGARPAPRPAAARPTGPPRRGGTAATGRAPQGGAGSTISRGVIALISLLGLVAVVVILLVVTSSGSSTHSSTTASAATNVQSARNPNGGTVITPASVTVAVLNGTSTSNLAHAVASRLSADGFKEGSIATASDQTQTATVVGYLPGHRDAALAVAKSLKLGSASVQPVDQSNRAVACPASSTPCAAKVIVTVGSDLASNP